MGFLTDGAGLPWIIALLVILIESLGALLLILGLFGRLNAALIGILMVGAILTAHADNGFFMNWSGKQAGEGFEYHLLALGIALALVVDGSGKYSIDRALKKRRK